MSHTRFFYFEGIGMDTCVIPLRHGGLSLVQTTDYIYPIVDDPYMMVWTYSSMGITFGILLIIHTGVKWKDTKH